MACRRLGLRFAIACVAFAGAAGARAATFDIVRSGPDVVTLLDPTAVASVDGGKVRRAWSVTVQRSLVSDGPQQPGYVRILNDYDCAAWKIRWRSFLAYSRFGDLVMRKDNDDAAWTSIDENFESAAGARIVCQGREAPSVYTASSIGALVLSLMQAWDAAAPMPPLQPVAPPAKIARAKHRDRAAQQR
jgi:surface-adhesin protein E